jgi:uncharacterized short protein YbdD (DUF466 family)
MSGHAAADARLGTVAAGAGGEATGADGPVARCLALVRRIIGVPDYAAYVRHMAGHHPGEPVLTEDQFAEERLTAKYSRPGQRCC